MCVLHAYLETETVFLAVKKALISTNYKLTAHGNVNVIGRNALEPKHGLVINMIEALG